MIIITNINTVSVVPSRGYSEESEEIWMIPFYLVRCFYINDQ